MKHTNTVLSFSPIHIHIHFPTHNRKWFYSEAWLNSCGMCPLCTRNHCLVILSFHISPTFWHLFASIYTHFSPHTSADWNVPDSDDVHLSFHPGRHASVQSPQIWVLHYALIPCKMSKRSQEHTVNEPPERERSSTHTSPIWHQEWNVLYSSVASQQRCHVCPIGFLRRVGFGSFFNIGNVGCVIIKGENCLLQKGIR